MDSADEQIVRELAERGPFTETDPCSSFGTRCADCGLVYTSADDEVDYQRSGDIHIPENHEPSCLWRRAREKYPPVAVPVAVPVVEVVRVWDAGPITESATRSE